MLYVESEIPETETLPSPIAAPQLNIAGQNPRFQNAFGVLDAAIHERAFPGVSVAVTYRGEIVAMKAFGNFTYDVASPGVTATTIFDIASLTKVVATTSMAMLLVQDGKLELDRLVAEVVPEFAGTDPRRKLVTMRMLLAHSSGLPGYVRLFEQHRNADDLFRAACAVELTADPKTKSEYSDIGFIVLGKALERIAGEPLDSFVARDVLRPLGMSNTMFNPPVTQREQIPPTEDDGTFRNKLVRGEVHDENAWVMGGVAGHAGLFSAAYDLALFAQAMLKDKAPFQRETIQLFTRRQDSPPGTSRALGWDTPSNPSQSGKHFGPRSYGHLGFTGCSLWIDPERELSVTLLTNRTWPDRKSELIKKVRPAFHDAVVEAL